jgi:hypothetical protein
VGKLSIEMAESIYSVSWQCLLWQHCAVGTVTRTVNLTQFVLVSASVPIDGDTDILFPEKRAKSTFGQSGIKWRLQFEI